MFVLNELERFLNNNQGGPQQANHDKRPIREIQRVDVARSLSLDRVKFQEINMDKELSGQHDTFDLKAHVSNRNYLTLDIQFAHLMKNLVLDRLAQIPERTYPVSRLMICDLEAYKSLLKFQFVARRLYPHGFLLQRPPFNVTAIVLLSEVVNLIRAVGRPIAVIKNQQTVNFDYTIIKQTFPFLKITDLIIFLSEVGDLKLGTYTMDGTEANQTIQFLAHFARSAHLIELLPISSKIGGQHPFFDNISVLRVPNYTEATQPATIEKPGPKTILNAHLEPTLLQLSFIAHRLQELINQLEWHLDSVTFRLGDPNGISKIFSQIIHSIERSQSNEPVSENPKQGRTLFMVPARVLVLDRFFDFQGLLRHTDLYGPFLEQENPIPNSDELSNLRLNDTDELDVTLQSVKLTDALKVILDHGSRDTANNQATSGNQIHRSSRTHAIRRHLDIVKSIYKSLCGGYLLMLKIESGLSDIMQMIRTSEVDLTNETQLSSTIERVQRIVDVSERLFSTQDNYLNADDMIRAAFLLLDTINVIIYLSTRNSAHFTRLNELKSIIKERTAINAATDTSNLRDDAKLENAKQRATKIRDKLDKFDALSHMSCSHRATASLEEIIEQFYHRKLDQKSYPRLKRPAASHGLAKNLSRNKIIVLILGSLSYDELTRIKSLEMRLMQRRARIRNKDRTTGDIVVMCCNVVRPAEFVRSV